MNVNVSPVKLERIAQPRELGFWKRLTMPQQFRVLDDVRVLLGEWQHTIPAGLVTDFASIPRCCQWLLPESLKFSDAALVHDDLYRSGVMGKRICDAVFAGLLEDVSFAMRWQAEIMFLAVHLFGFSAWNDHRRADKVSLTS